MNASPGDKIKIVVKYDSSSKEYVGTLLPRNELADQDIIVVKLENGYNVGIKTERIESEEIIQKYEAITQEESQIKIDTSLPKVAILSFGGTISSRLDYKTGGVVAEYDANDFVKMIPELRNIAQIEAKMCDQFMSEDAKPHDWINMAHHVNEYLLRDDITGVVVTHGTDTMHFSSSILSFMLQDLHKPVIITGSQRSIDRGSSDAFENVLCSVIAAANWDGAEVAVCMHESSNDGTCILSRGNKVRKMHTSRRDAFRPINERELAKIQTDGIITIINQKYNKRSDSTLQLKNTFEEKIGLIYVYPGMQPEQFDCFIKQKYKGLVIAATALGHIPQNVLEKVQECLDANIFVVIASQTLYGQVHKYVYARLREQSVKMGMIFAADLLPETAYTKLGWVLSQTSSQEEAKKLFEKNICHEFAQEIDVEAYLN